MGWDMAGQVENEIGQQIAPIGSRCSCRLQCPLPNLRPIAIMNCDAIVQIRIKNHQMKMDEKSPVLHPIITVSWQWRTSFLSLLIWRCPKFTFSTFTPDPNLQNPHLHKLKYTQLRFTHTKIYTATYWQTQIYTTQIYTKLNLNLQRHKFTLC